MQFHALWQHCRAAKEKLLTPGAKEKGGADYHPRARNRSRRRIFESFKLKRSDLEAILLDGFLPLASSEDYYHKGSAGL